MSKISVIVVLSLIFVGMQNCGKVSFNEGLPAVSEVTPQSVQEIPLQRSMALAYGADAEDRRLLNEKILGYAPPDIGEIFNNWRRFSSGTVFASGRAVVPEPAYSFCFSGLDANGNWNSVRHPTTGVMINPSVHGDCVNSVSLASASWSYLRTPDRLYNATNSGSFNGFISTLKFDRYTHEATLTSPTIDDDAIGLVVAFHVDSAGVVHTLTAMRTQGGTAPRQGWALIYRRNTTLVKVIGEKAVGTPHCSNSCNPTAPGSDGRGWNGRMTRVRVERDLNKIVATTGTWGTNEASLTIEPTSRIEVDLDDASLGLQIFKGAQSYGYGILSQQSSNFRNIKFNTRSDIEYVYDLVNDLVYRQKTTGGYALVPGVKAFEMLQYPRYVGNVETQKEFRLNPNYTFDLMP